MAYTQADLDKLKEAIASGARRVSFADSTVEYRDLDEMLRAQRMIEAELDVPAATRPMFQRVAYRRR